MCVFCSLESSKNIIYRHFSGLLGQITMSEVKMGESLSLKNWGLKRSWRLSVKFPWGFGLCTCVSAAGLENMYVQIFRHACESGGTAELLAILIWVLSRKTAKFRISAQRVAVLLDMEGADGRLADTHGCAKTHPAPPNDLICSQSERWHWRQQHGVGGSLTEAKATGHRLWYQFVDSMCQTHVCMQHEDFALLEERFAPAHLQGWM